MIIKAQITGNVKAIVFNEFIIIIQKFSFLPTHQRKGLFYDHTDTPILSHVNELVVRKKHLVV